VTKIVGRAQRGFVKCFEDGRSKRPALQGFEQRLEVGILPTGAVGHVRAAGDGGAGADVSSCVIEVLRRLRFPAAPDEGARFELVLGIGPTVDVRSVKAIGPQ
jgi:hypothetical protein